MRRIRGLFLLSLLAVTVWAGACSGGTSTTSSGAPDTSPPASPTTTSLPAPDTTQAPTSTTIATLPEPSTTVRPAPPKPPGGGAGQEYLTLPVGEEPVVALTFDAAYDPAPLADILAALADAGVPGTFFLTGEFVEDFPDSVDAIVAAGHPIGNHSYSHPDFTELGAEETQRQLRRTAELIEERGAGDPRPLFRPPFGARNDLVLKRLADEGYVSIYWTIDTLDWKPERTPAEIRSAVLNGLRPGAIVLMHVGSRQTAQVLPDLIAEISQRGYGFVTVPAALP